MATDGIVAFWEASSGSPAYGDVDLRRLFQVDLMPGDAAAPFSGRSGRRVNNSGLAVTVDPTGAGSVSVSAGAGVIYDPGFAVQASWRFVLPTAKTVALAARPGSGTSRIDLVIARIYDSKSGAGAVKELKIEVVAGTANATPAAPSLPPLSMELARLTVTSTSGAAISKTDSTAVTVAAGGILPVATSAERDALKTAGIAYRGMYVDVASTNSLERYDGTNWVPARPGIVTNYFRVDAAASYANGATIGTMAFPSIPVASRILLNATGQVGFNGSAADSSLVFVASAGTLVDAGLRAAYSTPGKWAAYSKAAHVNVPANTAVTVTTTFSTSPSASYWDGLQTGKVLLPGEY